MTTLDVVMDSILLGIPVLFVLWMIWAMIGGPRS